ncbi:DUF7573 domain-containing protein [Haloparvum sedimenti]|uniref:DUF7573 domain-containing protein n=1 Tax=Haloparvum sedimenti TaxID=1678448 RepID=UPI00071E8E94|nr:hypothetical protein [Haloparvum sedimenti]
MPEDRSLDDFAGEASEAGETDEAGEESASPSDAPAESTENGSESERTDTDSGGAAADPDPATPTADWTTGGTDCERCGATVERRWLDDGDRVCADCKAW